MMPSSIKKKLNKMGIDCREDDIISSGIIAIKYVQEHNYRNVYLLTSDELKKGFADIGIKECDVNNTDVMVIGMDADYCYEKMIKGLRAALNSKTIIACNEDRWFKKEDGVYPGNGAIVSSITYPSGKKVDVLIGKPSTIMPDYIVKRYNYQRNEVVIIGDSMESDGEMAAVFGCDFIIVSENDVPNRGIKSLKDTMYWDWNDYSSMIGSH